ncbi:sensor histidine kinase [Humidisolicoccus flavus]|uniref:sensor histidine kinase n=1 Tax=Humidisolicoccus flavus TaxID=3111414 RepID=UPI00324D3597
MQRISNDLWTGLISLSLCIGLAVPIIISPQGRDALLVAFPVWLVLYLAFLAAMVAVSLSENPGPLARISLVALVLLSCTIVFTAPGAGWIPIVLVFVASLSVYVVPPGATALIILCNTSVLSWATALTDAGLFEVAFQAAIYLALQVASSLFTSTLQREQSMRTELSEAHLQLQATGILLESQSRSDERVRISRELHDLLGHQLTVLALELEAANHREGAAAREHTERAHRVAKELLQDVRTTVGELRRAAPDLRHAAEELARAVPRPHIALEFADDFDDALLTDESKVTVFVRVMQEAITNSIRHSDAEHLRAHFSMPDRGSVSLTLSDDGGGSTTAQPGNGLNGMRERIEALGGTLAIDGSDGFTITATVPQ